MSEGKSNTGLIIGIVIALVLVCGGGALVVGFFFYLGAANTTTTVIVPAAPNTIAQESADGVTYPYSKTIVAFKTALQDADHAAAYALLSETYRQEVSLGDFIRQVADFAGLYESDPNSVGLGTFEHVATPGELSTGKWSQMVWGADGERTERLDLIEETTGVWRIDGWVIE